VVALHACILRLAGLGAAHSLLAEGPAEALPPPALDALLRELDERTAVGSEFSSAQDEWLASLQAQNPAAAQAPAFRTFFAGISQWLRAAAPLREFRDQARAGKLAQDPEALLGVVGGWQPVRWISLRGGAPLGWLAALCPPAPPEAPLQRLGRECEAALELLGRLWTARGLSGTAFAALASLFVARVASALALWEELGAGAAR
jgi:hypothetical protein